MPLAKTARLLLLVCAPTLTSCESCEFSGIGAIVQVTIVGTLSDEVSASVCYIPCPECDLSCDTLQPFTPLPSTASNPSPDERVFQGSLFADSRTFGCRLPAFELRAEAPGCTANVESFPEGLDYGSRDDPSTFEAVLEPDCG